MDIPSTLSGSAVFLLAVLLWLNWVAPSLVRRPRSSAALVVHTPSQRHFAQSRIREVEVGTLMQAQDTTAQKPARPAVGSEGRSSGSAHDSDETKGDTKTLRIRYGRTTLALIALIALLTMLVSGVLAAVRGSTPAVSILSALVFLGSLSILRLLAKRDMKRRQMRRLHETRETSVSADHSSSPASASEEAPDAKSTGTADTADAAAIAETSSVAHSKRTAVKSTSANGAAANGSAINGSGVNGTAGQFAKSGRPFDSRTADTQAADSASASSSSASSSATQNSERNPRSTESPNTSKSSTAVKERTADQAPDRGHKLMYELRTEAKTVTKDDLRRIALTQAKSVEWTPVQLPKPTYTQGAKATHPLPEPLEKPEAFKPEGKVNIAREESVKRAAQEQSASAEAASSVEADSPAAKTAASESAKINLDDVLQRRRA